MACCASFYTASRGATILAVEVWKMMYPVEAPAHGLIQGIGQVGSAQNQDARLVAADALHLHQELGLDAAGRLALAIPSAAAQRINLRRNSPQ